MSECTQSAPVTDILPTDVVTLHCIIWQQYLSAAVAVNKKQEKDGEAASSVKAVLLSWHTDPPEVSADDVCHVSLYREVADPKSRKARRQCDRLPTEVFG